MSDFLRPHGLQRTKLPCASLSLSLLKFVSIESVMLSNHLILCNIKPINPKGNQQWIFTGRTDAEAEAPLLWLPNVKSWLIGKQPDAVKRLRAGGGGGDRGWVYRKTEIIISGTITITGSDQTGDGKSEGWRFRNQWTKMDWNGWI